MTVTLIDVLAATAVLLAGTGVIVGIAGIVGTTRPPRPPSPTRLRLYRWWTGPQASRTARRARQARLAAAAGGGAVTWLLSGWPVAGVIVTLAVVGVPWLIASGKAESRAITRLRAVEAWTRRVADIVANGIGLQQAIVATATTAPALIRAEVADLAARLQAGTRAEAALRQFADQLDDYTADQVIAPIILHLSDRGEGLAHVLTDIATSVAAEIEMRSTINAKQAGPRFAVRFLTGMTVALLGYGALNPTYLRPYATFGGQVILALLAAFYIALMIWVRRLSIPERRTRLLSTGEAPG